MSQSFFCYLLHLQWHLSGELCADELSSKCFLQYRPCSAYLSGCNVADGTGVKFSPLTLFMLNFTRNSSLISDAIEQF